MNIKFLEFRRYNEKTDTYTWRIRRLYPEELNPLVQVRRAATIARKLSPKFFGKIRIANLDVMRSEYEPILAGSDQDAMWIHEVFLRRCIPNLTTDELASIFLHEAAHLMHRLYPEELKKIWSEDLAWQNTLARYPEITLNTSWFSEIMANTFAIKLSGMCALEAMDKVHKHSCDHVRMLYRIDLFGENEHNLSLKKTYDILQFYWRQREQLKKQSHIRMPLSPRKANTKYTTTESNNTSQIGRDEKENYFEFVVKCANGYDFLESLLKIHPMIEILPEWQDIQLVACNDGTRQKQVKQFVHDVTTLMKLLLGSANMAVDNYGNFIYENLPYGPIRSNRGSLSRTALGTNGSIKRICDELQRCWFSKQETDKYIQRLQRLHLHLRFPSFEQQREDIDGLLSIEYSNSTPSMKL